MKSIEVFSPGDFEPDRHLYPRVLNAQIHPLVRHFLQNEDNPIHVLIDIVVEDVSLVDRAVRVRSQGGLGGRVLMPRAC